MTKRTLIAYETYYGSTKQAALEIERILKEDFNHDVTVKNIGAGHDCPELADFDNVIIGSCIYNGQWASHAEQFLNNKFEGQKVALFVCAMFAGNKKLYSQAYQSYLETKTERYKHLKPVSMEAFGGKVSEKEYPDQWLESVASLLPEFTTDNRNLEKVKKWIKKLGKLLSK